MFSQTHYKKLVDQDDEEVALLKAISAVDSLTLTPDDSSETKCDCEPGNRCDHCLATSIGIHSNYVELVVCKKQLNEAYDIIEVQKTQLEECQKRIRDLEKERDEADSALARQLSYH